MEEIKEKTFTHFMNTMHKESLTKFSWIGTGILPEELGIGKNSPEFETLWNMRPGYRNKIKIFGKEYDMPREQQVFGISEYTYSGTTFQTIEEMPPFISFCLSWANNMDKEQVNETNGCTENPEYNMVLVNWYFNGKDNIGWHKDDEKEIIPGTDVMTITFGEKRKFKIKHDTQDICRDYPTIHNGYIVMGGDFQKEFKHSIPKTTNKGIQGRRISLTFRKFKK